MRQHVECTRSRRIDERKHAPGRPLMVKRHNGTQAGEVLNEWNAHGNGRPAAARGGARAPDRPGQRPGPPLSAVTGHLDSVCDSAQNGGGRLGHPGGVSGGRHPTPGVVMISTCNIYWLAGLLEGEGHFGYMGRTPRVDLWTTDRDVIEQAATLVSKLVVTKPPSKYSKKTQFGFTACGSDAWGIMFTVYSLLGKRRRRQIQDAVEKWRQRHLLSRNERSAIARTAAKRLAARLGSEHFRQMGRLGTLRRWGALPP